MSNVIKYGIDVSEHNGQILWDNVKASGKVDFAILRAGYGSGVVDKQFHNNARACTRLGIPFGVYWFSYAKSVPNVEIEANCCLETIKDYDLAYPVAFDFEDDSVRVCKQAGIEIVGKGFATALAQNFLSIVKDSGYKAALYSNPAYLNQYFDISRLDAYDLWLAQWPATPDPTVCPVSQPAIWQYSSNGRIPGIGGPVDLNVCYVDYETPTVKASVMEQQWAKDAIRDAVKYGISDGSRPEDPATRIEVMAMATRAFMHLAEEFNKKLEEAFNERNNDGK